MTLTNSRSEPPTPAIGYIRVSMAREEMISPELQRAAITTWAARTNHRIIDWVEDLDKTGRNFKRRIMGAIERVERGEARVIAVWKYSRFGRSRIGVPANLARVEQAGGQLLSATEEVDIGSSFGRLQRGVIMEFNAFESERAGEQWKQVQQKRREEGLPASGRRRFGYIWYPRKTYGPDGTVTLQTERYEIDQKLAPMIAEAYRRYISGEGFKQITTMFNNAGITTLRGSLWADHSVRMYMDSGFAAGYLRIHDPSCTVPYRTACPNHLLIKHPENHHPAIIDEETWAAYQARRGLMKVTPPRARRAAHPLSGLVRCGRCQGAARRTITGSGYTYFVCNQRKTKGSLACDGVSIPQKDAEQQVRSWLATLCAEIDGPTETKTARIRGEELQRVEVEAARLQDRVDQLGRAITRHMKAYALAGDDGGELEADFVATLNELRAERATAAAELEAARKGQSEDGAEAVRLQVAAPRVAAGVMAEWETVPPWVLNTMLRQLVASVSVLPGRVVEVVAVWE